MTSKFEKIDNFRKNLNFAVTGQKKGKNSIFFLITKICIKNNILTNFHISFITFFEEIINFSIFGHFVLDNRENGRFCSTAPQELSRKSKNMLRMNLKF